MMNNTNSIPLVRILLWLQLLAINTVAFSASVTLLDGKIASAKDHVHSPAISGDGRYIAYVTAFSFVKDDKNDLPDLYLYDRVTGNNICISIGYKGKSGDGQSFGPVISKDGRYVVFTSAATDLDRTDRNKATDVICYSVNERTLTLISLSGNNNSFAPSISADGRYITFLSDSDNLVDGDDNKATDVFLFDQKSKRTNMVSKSSHGVIANAGSAVATISGDGRIICYSSWADNLIDGDNNKHLDVFAYSVDNNSTEIISLSSSKEIGNDDSGALCLSISEDGGLVAFLSDATNIVPDDKNGYADIFLRDRKRNTTTIINVTPDGLETNNETREFALNSDGSKLAFKSLADNLTPGDGNHSIDVFMRDIVDKKTFRISCTKEYGDADAPSSDGYGALAIDVSGKCVLFDSYARNLDPMDKDNVRDLYVWNSDGRNYGGINATIVAEIPVAGSNDADIEPRLSSDGKYIVYSSILTDKSFSHNASDGIRDIILYDTKSMRKTVISKGINGNNANADCFSPSICADGSRVTFASYANNLVPGDTNNKCDIFIWDNGVLTRISTGNDGFNANGNSRSPSISSDGRYIVYTSDAVNITKTDKTNDHYTQIYIYDIEGKRTRCISMRDDRASRSAIIDCNGESIAYWSQARCDYTDADRRYPSIYMYNSKAETNEVVTIAFNGASTNGPTYDPISMSTNGRYIVYMSYASNLVPGTNKESNIYISDSQQKKTTCITSTAENYAVNHSPVISGDGNTIAYISRDSTLGSIDYTENLMVYKQNDKSMYRINVNNGNNGKQYFSPHISYDGSMLVYGSMDASGKHTIRLVVLKQ